LNLDSIKDKKTALVLSGGVVKAAAWHNGVVLALDEIGFSFKSNNQQLDSNKGPEISTYVASSAGTLISLFLASGYSAKDITEAQLKKLIRSHPFLFLLIKFLLLLINLTDSLQLKV